MTTVDLEALAGDLHGPIPVDDRTVHHILRGLLLLVHPDEARLVEALVADAGLGATLWAE